MANEIAIGERGCIMHVSVHRPISRNGPQQPAADEARQEGRLPAPELRKGIPVRKSEGDARRLEGGPEEDRGEKSSPARP